MAICKFEAVEQTFLICSFWFVCILVLGIELRSLSTHSTIELQHQFMCRFNLKLVSLGTQVACGSFPWESGRD